MLKTSAFFQLAPGIVDRLRNNYRTTNRINLPSRLAFLKSYGVDEDEWNALKAMAMNDLEERILVAWVLLEVFRGENFLARSALLAWMRRKGEYRPELKAAAVNYVHNLMQAEDIRDAEVDAVCDTPTNMMLFQSVV